MALIGLRGAEGICAQVVAHGFVLSLPDVGSSPDLVDPFSRVLSKSDLTPPGYVFVDLSAYRLGADELMPAGTACEGPGTSGSA